jgi:hypothetical protein
MIFSNNSSKEIPTAFAIFGTRLVEVIPGKEFTSRQYGLIRLSIESALL